jgi:malate dehydrogenase (oxaloacetate-decarboxylating)
MVTDKSQAKPTVDELLAKAKKPAQLSPPMHKFYEGKMQVIPKCVIRSVDDFAIWYTPGVAAACKEIQANTDKSFEYTNRWNYVGIITDTIIS